MLSNVYSICILWISAHTDFSRRWGISVKTCRLPLPWLHRFFPSSWRWVSTLWFWAAQGVPLHEWNQMWGPGQRCRAQEPAQLPSCHRKCTGCAHLYTVPIYSPTLNNVKIEDGYYVLLHIVSYFGPPPKTHNQPMADDIFWPASCALSIIHRNT